MFIPIIAGALEFVPQYVFKNIQNLDYTKNEPKKLVDPNQPGLFWLNNTGRGHRSRDFFMVSS